MSENSTNVNVTINNSAIPPLFPSSEQTEASQNL